MKKKSITRGVLFSIVAVFIIIAAILHGNIQKKYVIVHKKYEIDNFEWQTKDCREYKWSGNCTYLKYNDIAYYFKTDSFNENEAEKCIWKINHAIEYMDSVFPDNRAEDIRVYIGFQDGEVLKKKDVVSIDESSVKFDDVWKILKKKSVNVLKSAEQYGLLYAYSIKNGIIEEEISKSQQVENTKQMREFFEEEDNKKFLDFNIPMLETAYFSEEEAEHTKLAAKQFAVWYANRNSMQDLEKLCKEIGSANANELEQIKNEWLESLGVAADYQEFSKILFQYNDYTDIAPDASYKIEAEDCVWLWEDNDITTFGYEYMVENYNLIEPLRKIDFEEAREYLRDYLPENLEKVKIKTNFAASDIAFSINEYVVAMQAIEVPMGWDEASASMLHEYCHHLTVGEGRLLESNSVFLEWYSVGLANFILQNKEQSLLTHYRDEEFLRNRGYWDEKNNCCRSSLLYMRGAMRKYYEKRSKNENRDNFLVSFSGLSYGERGTLFYYITETYGFDKMVELGKLGAEEFENVLGITFQQLYFDMIDWLKPQLEDDEWLQQKLEEEGYNLQI